MSDDYKIVVDTREQAPLWTGKEVIEKKLDAGDYSIEGYEDKIAIERKSPGDLFGTLGKGNKRFKQELERALKLEYFAIVIEENIMNINNKTFDGAAHIRDMKGYVILKILFTIHVKYGVPVFFCNDRHETKRVVRNIFGAYVLKKDREKALLKRGGTL